MKPRSSSARKPDQQRGLPQHLPMAWMDPMSWRLPSGQALAEFALQSGFLAPLILGAPAVKHRKSPASAPGTGPKTPAAVIEKHLGEGPDASGTFRGTR